jgi:hypothetical protein
MATAALTLGIVGLFTWLFPPLGFFICVLGVIFGAIVIARKYVHRKMAIAGLVTGSVGLILNILVIAIAVTAIGILGIFGEFLDEFMHLYSLPY